ncbi:MAG: hypothetical protein RLZZ211_129 [Bacteroidota bacterium]
MSQSRQKDIFWLNWCKDELRQGRDVRIKAFGMSMYPVIKSGQEIQISFIDMQSVVSGMLIAFQRQNHVVVHRVIDTDFIEKGQIYCQGDANFYQDEPISAHNFIGSVALLNGASSQKKKSHRLFKMLIYSFRLMVRVLSKSKQFANSFQPNK